MDDLDFVQRCIKGDKSAWNEFISRYSRLIYNYIHSVLKVKGFTDSGDLVSDVFQGVFCHLIDNNYHKLKSYKGSNGCSLASWLRQITINYTLDCLRKHKNTVSLDEDNDDGLALSEVIPVNLPPVDELISKEEKLISLQECIELLDSDEKYLLELNIFHGVDLESLKDHLKVSRGAIDMKKSRIIGKLKDCFKRKGFKLDL